MADASKVVVVVEDDELTRMALVEGLTVAGFNVIEAADAADAMELLKWSTTSIHALVTDNRMPGTMSGVKLARFSSENWPWINLVVAAGEVSMSDLPARCRYFQKPYRIAEMVKHLAALR